MQPVCIFPQPHGRKCACAGSRQGLTSVVALDCEMVGVGPGGERSALARSAVCPLNCVTVRTVQDGGLLDGSCVQVQQEQDTAWSKA